MNPRDFAYWLQGFMELHEGLPTEKQWQMIKEHLQTVFAKVTPDHNIKSDSSGVQSAITSMWPSTVTIC